MSTLSTKDVKKTLEMLRQGADLQSPLMSLEAIKWHIQREGKQALTPEEIIGSFIEEIVVKELGDLRSLLFSLGSTAQTMSDYEWRLAEDFRIQNRDLEAWSAVYHRYCLPILNLQVQQMAQITMNNDKYIQRRLDRGLRLLTQAIARQESEILRRISNQHSRLISNLPGLVVSELIDREKEFNELSQRLRDTNGFWVISLEGLGGMGKTALAYALVDQSIREHLFLDVACLSAKREVYKGERIEVVSGSLLSSENLFEGIISQLEFGDAIGLGSSAKRAFLSKKLREAPYLILIDNLETAEDYHLITDPLVEFIRPTKVIVTTRKHLDQYDYVSRFELSPLSKEATFQLVRHDARGRGLDFVTTIEDQELFDIYQVTGGNPLAIKLVVGLLTRFPLEEIIKRLTKARGKSADEFYRFIYWQSWQLLSSYARDILLIMPLFPVDGTDEAIRQISGLEENAFRQAISELINLSLVNLGGTVSNHRYSIHPLTQHFVLAEVVKKWKP